MQSMCSAYSVRDYNTGNFDNGRFLAIYSPLVVRDKVGRPPGEFVVNKSVECDIFPSVL